MEFLPATSAASLDLSGATLVVVRMGAGIAPHLITHGKLAC